MYPPEIREACLDLYAQGYTLEHISMLAGPTAATISRWVAEEKKFCKEDWTDEKRAAVANRCSRGDSPSWVARRYGISRVTLWRWRKKFCKM